MSVYNSYILTFFGKLILVEKIYAYKFFSLFFFFFFKVSQVYPHFQFILIRRDTCVLFPFLRSFSFLPISFQQIYPVLAVIVSLNPRLHDVKPSGRAPVLFFLFARRNLAVQLGVKTRRDRTGRSSHATRRNKSLTMKNHLEEMGRNFCSSRFINGDTGTDDRTDKSVIFWHRYRKSWVNAHTGHHFSSHWNISRIIADHFSRISISHSS